MSYKNDVCFSPALLGKTLPLTIAEHIIARKSNSCANTISTGLIEGHAVLGKFPTEVLLVRCRDFDAKRG
jgi:hypothetical protein